MVKKADVPAVKQIARCFKCRKPQEMKNITPTKFKNGRTAIKGECVVCGTKMFKFVKSEKKEA